MPPIGRFLTGTAARQGEAKLETKGHRRRRHSRRKLRIDASLRDASDAARAGAITDLSQTGCRMEIGDAALEPDELVIVRPGALGGVSGRVRWQRGNAAGVEFADPLHPAVVDHVSGERELEGHAPSPPRQDRSGFTDHFGRPLPTLGNRRGR